MDLIWIIVLDIIIPVVFFAVGLLLILIKYYEMRSDMEARGDHEGLEKMKKNRTKVFILGAGTILPSLIYGILFTVLSQTMVEDPMGYEENVIGYAVIALSVGAVVSIVAQTIWARIALPDVVNDEIIDFEKITGKKRGSRLSRSDQRKIQKMMWDKTTYSKHLVIETIPHTVAIYSLLIGVLVITMVNSANGDVESTYAITKENANSVNRAIIIFSVTCLPAVVSGFLPNIVEGNDKKTFFRRIVLSVIPTIPAIVGLFIFTISITY